jgi:hypothetical protein
MQRNKEENTCKFGTHVECGQGAGGLRSFIIAIRLIGVLNPSSPGHLTWACGRNVEVEQIL